MGVEAARQGGFYPPALNTGAHGVYHIIQNRLDDFVVDGQPFVGSE